ncbi:MAG: hypothetical protein ACFCUX_03885 [Candidatus Methylacidiphilales bacterium]
MRSIRAPGLYPVSQPDHWIRLCQLWVKLQSADNQQDQEGLTALLQSFLRDPESAHHALNTLMAIYLNEPPLPGSGCLNEAEKERLRRIKLVLEETESACQTPRTLTHFTL